MMFRCGHEVEQPCLGRGKARERRMEELALQQCEACAKVAVVKYAASLTNSKGEPLPAEMQARAAERCMVRRQQTIYKILL